MDTLAVISVAGALHRLAGNAVLRDFAEQAPLRFRVRLEHDERAITLVACCRPEAPWLAAPVGRWPGRADGRSPFAARCRRELVGSVLSTVDRPVGDRRIELVFADGRRLVAELAPSRANLILIDGDGTVSASARRPPSERERLAPGSVYRPAAPAPGRHDPLAPELDDGVAEWTCEGVDDAASALRRTVLGLSAEAAAAVVAEAALSGTAPARLLRDRAETLARGRLAPVVCGPGDAVAAAREGTFRAGPYRLWPWPPPPEAVDPDTVQRGRDALATVGIFHDGLDRSGRLQRRAADLMRIVDGEIERLRSAEQRVASDLASFEDPDRHRRHGEALLAGVASARREGASIRVPDPYDADAAWLVIPAPGGIGAAALADAAFARHRRAVRGIRHAEARASRLRGDRESLQRIRPPSPPADQRAVEALEAAMRDHGLAVGLEGATSARRQSRAFRRARLPGVRILRTRDGATLLVGKTARDNHRLTFQIATAEDFWFHALGVTGAHVVLRNERRLARPGESAMVEAARIAAWFSESRRNAAVDVQWTRRKYVRRLRGAPPGTVGVKRFETIRVAPEAPREPDGDGIA